MYIYHKQCEILQKNHRKAQTFNFRDFPLKRDESYANANAETVGQNHFFKKIRWS